MTLPVNRFNSLCDTRRFLASVTEEKSMPDYLWQRALSLHYPLESELRSLAEVAPELLSAKVLWD